MGAGRSVPTEHDGHARSRCTGKSVGCRAKRVSAPCRLRGRWAQLGGPAPLPSPGQSPVFWVALPPGPCPLSSCRLVSLESGPCPVHLSSRRWDSRTAQSRTPLPTSGV